MIMKEKFAKAVNNNDVDDVRLFLSNELMLDPRGESFCQMKALAEARMAGLFEEDNGGDYSTPQTAWNEDYLYRVKNDLDLNFSKERLAHFEQVVKTVLADKASALRDEGKTATTSRPQPSGRSMGQKDTRKAKRPTSKAVPAAVTLAGVALTVAGLCASKAVLATVGIIGIAAGGYLLIKETRQ